jgi:phage tail tape-measure protein
MTERSVIQGETITEDGVERRATLRKDYGAGVRHRDEEAGGAVGGGVAGAIVGAVVAGPVGAVVGGAIGAATGATAGAIDEKDKDEKVVVTREVQRP